MIRDDIRGRMTLWELDESQLEELRQRHLIEHMDGVEEPLTWNELANASEIVPFETLVEDYGHISFTEGDFWGE